MGDPGPSLRRPSTAPGGWQQVGAASARSRAVVHQAASVPTLRMGAASARSPVVVHQAAVGAGSSSSG
eukprot:11477054-Alexandrium_andersonii.AAC.1